MLIYVNTIKCCACETLNLVQCSITMNVLCAAGDCVLKHRSQPAAVSIPLYNIVTIVQIFSTLQVK